MLQTPRDRQKRAAESPVHASAVAELGPRQHAHVKQQQSPSSWIISSIKTSTCQQQAPEAVHPPPTLLTTFFRKRGSSGNTPQKRRGMTSQFLHY